MERAIRNLHSDHQERFCDVIIENGEIYLFLKIGKNKFKKIPWGDVVYQVEAAQAAAV